MRHTYTYATVDAEHTLRGRAPAAPLEDVTSAWRTLMADLAALAREYGYTVHDPEDGRPYWRLSRGDGGVLFGVGEGGKPYARVMLTNNEARSPVQIGTRVEYDRRAKRLVGPPRDGSSERLNPLYVLAFEVVRLLP
jgi:hypothetical protein